MKRFLITLALLIAAPTATRAEPEAKPAPDTKDMPFFTPERDKKGMKGGDPVDPNLPNVLILGDSISIGYTKQVRQGLKGKANLIRPNANCGDTRIGLANIDKWLGDTKWDVIHFNWGLWDLCYRNPDSKTQGNRDKTDGKISVPIPEYEKNLETLVERLKRTGATLIWANTTFVPEGEVGRFAGDEVIYNAAAARIMEKHGVNIDDLHAITSKFGPEFFSGPGNVHYKPEGSAKLAAQVVAEIEKALEITSIKSGVIDCHVHLYSLSRPDGITWIDKANEHLYRDHLPANHEPIAKANGVTGVVLVQAGQSIPDNQWNLDVTAHDKSLYRGVVGNLSRVIGTAEFAPLFSKLCEDPRYLGYRISGREQKEMDEDFYRDLELTAAAGKSVDFLVGDYSLKDVDAVAKKMPKLRIIIDHFGGVKLDGKPLDPAWIEDFRAVAKNKNVYCKVSALYGRVSPQPAPQDLAFYKPILDLAFECFGEDRLVYGSDWPVTKNTGNYASVLTLTRSYFEPKGAEICGKLFHRNAERFYAIPPVE